MNTGQKSHVNNPCHPFVDIFLAFSYLLASDLHLSSSKVSNFFISVVFLSFSCPPVAIKPRRHAGTIQRWQSCTKHWVRKETIKAPCEMRTFVLNPHWGAATRRHCTSALEDLSHSSLGALCLKHLRDNRASVISLPGPNLPSLWLCFA